jgi:putative FmdB family regulatory protein
MPIYEYECRDCRRIVSLLVLKPSAAAAPACPRCGGSALTRVMSRFATVKSEEARLESLADPSALGDLDENDPASVARFMKRMGRELGEDLGDDFEEAVDEAMAEAEAGEGEGVGGDGEPSTSTSESTADDL